MPRPDLRPTGAAELLWKNKTAGSSILHKTRVFSNLTIKARPIHESLRRGVSLFIRKYATWMTKCPALTAPTVNRHLITEQSGDTEYQRKRLPEPALRKPMLIRGKGAY